MALTTDIIEITEHTLPPGINDIVMTSTGGFENALVATYTVPYGIYPSNMYIDNDALHITYESHTDTIYLAVLLIRNDLQVINHLESNLEGAALSAKQGKELKALIDAIGSPALSDLTDVDLDSLTADDILIYDGLNRKWINTPLPTYDIADLDDVTITSPSNGQALLYDNGEWINGSVAGGVNYSETEQDTGRTWINGSKIYQRTFLISKSDLTSQGNNNYKYSTAITFGRIIAFKNVIQYNNSFATLPSGTTNTSYMNYINVIDATGITFTLGSSMYNILNDIAVTIEYTH